MHQRYFKLAAGVVDVRFVVGEDLAKNPLPRGDLFQVEQIDARHLCAARESARA